MKLWAYALGFCVDLSPDPSLLFQPPVLSSASCREVLLEALCKVPFVVNFSLQSLQEDLKTIFLLNPKSIMSSLRPTWHLMLISKLSWKQAPRPSFFYAYATSAHCLSLLCGNHQLRVLSPSLPVLTASSTTNCLSTDPGSLLWSLQILLPQRLPWWLVQSSF